MTATTCAATGRRRVPRMGGTLLQRMANVNSVPRHVLVLTIVASYAGQILAGIAGWPLWALVLATLLPWALVFTVELNWTYRHFHWLALFYLLVITQGGHLLEHVVQMVQIHVLNLTGPAARGIFGQLDIEWIHVSWNTWVLVAVLILLVRYRRNPWLWMTLVLAGWHELEHLVILSRYLATGIPGDPGLLAAGGVIGGGLPVKRPDLHFYYNMIETIPLFAAFGYALKHTYDEWLAQAFPHASASLLIETTNRLDTMRFRPGETVITQGGTADRFYIISRGQAEVTRKTQDGEIHAATLGPGQFFGEIGLLTGDPRTATVRAKSALEVLSLDRDSFRQVVEQSEATAQDLARVVRERTAQLKAEDPAVTS